ncbi:MAG: hypothetical protein AVDCRST_MAG49-2826 [uncultured Thermomicrobiales bacterium]|uniref:Uncharacterized protein n=1 Tax=uncultured Thermomicrobiales bacterium TaxID=1645740 RepID=A0A6J4V2I9_9BACT|nr:MAG: hypothetical protein AVDCRST_MAG49-2826 [uncultured Thermomicrobiales bacterium]
MPLPSSSSRSSGGMLAGGDRRVIAAGLMAGAAIGVWAGGRLRTPARALGPSTTAARPAALIDWDRARQIAVNMNRGAALTAPERERLDRYYRELVRRCVPLVEDFTGTTLPPTVERTFVFDRVDWIDANLEAFKPLFAPLEEFHAERSGAATPASNVLGGVNQTIVSAELGVLLGYLARRVLGQYDLALLGREPISAGKLYYVEPNIRAVERALGLPREDFRMWLALHETTHAFEFEAHPWVRVHFNSLLMRYIEYLKQDAEHLKQGLNGLRVFAQRVRGRDAAGQQSWIEVLMSPEQRALFSQMQAMMCIIEGFSNHVMNGVGRDLLPTYDLIAERFERRQRQRSAAEQLFARLIALDVKLEQYRLGEAFIARVVAERGETFARRLWAGPESLPTMTEIRAPEQWIARMEALQELGTAAPGDPRDGSGAAAG